MGRNDRKQDNKTVSNEFTNSEQLKIDFFNNADNRRKAGDKAHGDAGYWEGRRCNWGGSHSLDEDAEILAKFFNSIAAITEEINDIRLSANEQIFHQRKQALITKIKDLSSKCRVTKSTSIAYICIIWNDFFGSFLKDFIDSFSDKLIRQLSAVEKLEPKHQRELLELEKGAQEAESAYKENLRKANEEEDITKKTEFIALANKAARKATEIKRKLKSNPLSQAANFNFLDDLKKLAKGSVPPSVSPDNQSTGNSSENSSSSNNHSSQDPKKFFEQYKTEIFFALALVGILVFIYTQNE
jgi:hypothetical protein